MGNFIVLEGEDRRYHHTDIKFYDVVKTVDVDGTFVSGVITITFMDVTTKVLSFDATQAEQFYSAQDSLDLS